MRGFVVVRSNRTPFNWVVSLRSTFIFSKESRTFPRCRAFLNLSLLLTTTQKFHARWGWIQLPHFIPYFVAGCPFAPWFGEDGDHIRQFGRCVAAYLYRKAYRWGLQLSPRRNTRPLKNGKMLPAIAGRRKPVVDLLPSPDRRLCRASSVVVYPEYGALMPLAIALRLSSGFSTHDASSLFNSPDYVALHVPYLLPDLRLASQVPPFPGCEWAPV